MCGIAGVVGPGARDTAVVAAMTRRLAHRGPDDEQLHLAPGVALGIRRLAIVDPAHGRQPVFSEDERVVAVCNGELYNHAALRGDLAQRGHRFRSGSDAEVLPHLYEESGARLVDGVRGIFALACYDAAAGRLVLARDRLGVKPLYYLETAEGLWFASEIKSLLLVPGFVPEVDGRALDALLAYKHIPGDRCLLSRVRLLLPGHRLVRDVATGVQHVEAYYALPDIDPPAPGFDDARREVVRRFDDAVAARLMSDVPVGVALSGGLDSSSVVASVARQTDAPPTTFSVYAGDSVDELPFARLVADRYKTDHHEVRVAPEALDAVVPRILWHLEEPLSISELPTWALGQAVGGRVKVLLCGEGADELFGGYKRFGPIAAAPWLPRSALEWGYVRGLNGLTGRDRARLYGPDLAASPNPWLEDAVADKRYPVLNRFLRYELAHELRSQELRLDKLTMAHAVEARCPFLDPPLVDYVVGLPPAMKVRRGGEKVLLKAAMADRLPAEILARRKLGMANPVRALFQGDFRDVCRTTLRERADLVARYFTPDGIEALFRDVGRRPPWWRLPEQTLFHIYLFVRWHEVFVEGCLDDLEAEAA